ncbi:replication initiation protein [Klebsiella pneumoniae]
MVKVARLDTLEKSVRTVTENKNPRFSIVWRQKKSGAYKKKGKQNMLIQEEYNRDKYINQIQSWTLCADSFENGTYRKPKEKALNKKYIGYNNNYFINGFVFDIDQPSGAIAWDDCGLPKPNIIIQNTANGHAHLLYALKAPVCKTDNARVKPLKLASLIQTGFTDRLKADRAYADVLMKNPINEAEWRTTWGNVEAYDLSYLSEFIPDDIQEQKRLPSIGLGRNVNLFEDLRHYAYKSVLKFKEKSNYERWEKELVLKADGLNIFCNSSNPLSYNEIKATARSVAKWTWRNFNKECFSSIQSCRGKKNAGKKKTKVRSKAKSNKMLEQIMKADSE